MSHQNNNVGACNNVNVNNNHQAYGFHGDDTNYDYLYRSEDEAAYREFYGLDEISRTHMKHMVIFTSWRSDWHQGSFISRCLS